MPPRDLIELLRTLQRAEAAMARAQIRVVKLTGRLA